MLPMVALFGLSCGKEEPKILPVLDIANVTVVEGNSNGAVIVVATLSEAATESATFAYTTADGTATAGQDYVAGSGKLTLAAGQTSVQLTIDLLGDVTEEIDEYFTIRLSEPVGCILKKEIVTVVITNDDLFIPTTGYDAATSYPGKSLVWSDEFNGTTLDASVWTPEIGTGNGGWGNNELQFYRAENTTLQNGNLVIEARSEAFGGRSYTSSRLITKGKKEFKYGRIDIRAALPEGQGVWPALWMLGSNIDAVSWPACGEIDIMEVLGHQTNRLYGTVHYGSNFSQRRSKTGEVLLPAGKNFVNEFHVFSIDWAEDRITFYLDDVQYFEFDKATAGADPYPFNNDFFFILNVAVGGNWPGNPDATTRLPQQMIVDYVRVYQ
jgi:beta-glucanase (GH16 family)